MMMTRNDFLKMIALASGALVVGVAGGVQASGKANIEPKIITLKRFENPYAVMAGDTFHLYDEGKPALTLIVTKMATITFWAKIYQQGEITYIVGDDEMLKQLKTIG